MISRLNYSYSGPAGKYYKVYHLVYSIHLLLGCGPGILGSVFKGGQTVNNKIQFWLIYADPEGRKCKPFYTEESMKKYCEREAKYITVLAKTKVLEED